MLATDRKYLQIFFLIRPWKYLQRLHFSFFIEDFSSLKHSSVYRRGRQVNDYTCNEFRETQSDSENAINSRLKYLNCFQYLIRLV